MALRPGGSVRLANAGRPLRLVPDAPYPVGTLAAAFEFSLFSNTPTSTAFALADGSYRSQLTMDSDGTISGTQGEIEGQLKLRSDVGSIIAHLQLADVSFTKPVAADASFQSRVLVTQVGLSLSVTTHGSGVPDHADARVFPISLTAQLPMRSLQGAQGQLAFQGRNVSLSPVIFRPTFRLVIPPGLGEHQNRDDPDSADGTHGPEELMRWQEVFFDDHAVCDIHVYVAPAEYDATAAVTLSIVNGVLQVRVGELRTAVPIGWRRDGCEVSTILAVVGAVLGPGGVVVGYTVGESLDDKINALIDGKLQGALGAVDKTWQIRP
jgi:hypothetical protein